MARYIDADKIDFSPLKDDFDRARAKVIIMGQPTANVVGVKHGKLIYSSTDNKLHCSERFSEAPRNNGDISYSEIYYCYKCGAKMDGRSETE